MIATTKNIHAAKAQLYRWYNGYERPFTKARIANQLDLLAEDIHFITPNQILQGKVNYAKALDAYQGMRIAHKIEEIAITEGEEGVVNISATILYHGIQSNGTDNYLRLTYDTLLQSQEEDLPLFKHIKLDLAGGMESPEFEDSYATTRSLAVLHYYLYNVERLTTDVQPFKEILTKDFQLNLSPQTKITTIDGLAQWLKGAATQVSITSHHPKNISVVEKGDYFELKVAFDWEGWTRTNKKMVASTHHVWQIVDQPNERFARIRQIDVETLVPFQGSEGII